MVRHFIAIVILFGIVVGVLYGLVNTPLLTEYYVPRFIQSQAKGLEVQSFKIGRQLFRFPDILELYDVQGRVSSQGKDYVFTAQKLIVYDLQQFFQNRQQLRLYWEGLTGESGDTRLNNLRAKVSLSWDQFIVTRIDGIFHGDGLSVLPYDLGEFTGRIKGNGQKIEIFELATKSYGGLAQGQIQVEMVPQCQYVLWLEYQGIDAVKVRSTGNLFFSQLAGTLQGSLRIVGNLGRVELLAMNFTMPQGGALGSSLLKRMMGPIDDLETKAQLETLLLSRDSFPVDSAVFAMRNAPGNKVVIDFNVNNKKEQLQLKGSQEFHFDLSLKGIFHQPTKKSLQQQ